MTISFSSKPFNYGLYDIIKTNLNLWRSAIALVTLRGLGASLYSTSAAASLDWARCSVSSALASLSSLFSANWWRHWEHSGSPCLLGHMLAVVHIRFALGLFMPTDGLTGALSDVMKLLASVLSMSAAELKSLSFRPRPYVNTTFTNQTFSIVFFSFHAGDQQM